MIKVNLLPQRKAKRSAADPSSKQLAMGIGGVAAFCALLFFAVDMPKRKRLEEIRGVNAQLDQQIAASKKKLAGPPSFDELAKAEEDSKVRADAINRLNAAKVVPAHVLHELGKILTREGPTMTIDMAKKAGNGVGSDPNKRFQTDWDTTHVWLLGFYDTNGSFRLDGAAQSESDVTQLSKRLAASAYFLEVSPAGGERVSDQATGTNYYRFTITGRLAY